MYLYRATGDPTLLELGRDAVESIEKISKVECGFATVSVSGAWEIGVSPVSTQKPQQWFGSAGALASEGRGCKLMSREAC